MPHAPMTAVAWQLGVTNHILSDRRRPFSQLLVACPLLYPEALAFITREQRDAAACRATGRTCFLGERSSIDLPEHDVERAEDRRDVGKHVPAAQEVHRL